MKALIVIDMQNDFIDGALGTPEAQTIVPNVKKKIEEYREREDWIYYTYDSHDKSYMATNEGKHLPIEHCQRYSHGWHIADGLINPLYKNLVTITKDTFGYSDWGIHGLEDFESIELVGLCTDICVVSNALILKANFPETEITVDASCCAGTTPENHKAALQVMKCCQINVIGE